MFPDNHYTMISQILKDIFYGNALVVVVENWKNFNQICKQMNFISKSHRFGLEFKSSNFRPNWIELKKSLNGNNIDRSKILF